ncbi:MAG: hypothetical protein DME42_09765 [Verrucomicrobia bacterium]|nr:MAG: hypothetical protein DME42_09765 [Verrucomicrobiota bacterium]
MNTNGHELLLPKSLRSANRSQTSPIQVWGAHAPRVLSWAPRQRLPLIEQGNISARRRKWARVFIRVY